MSSMTWTSAPAGFLRAGSVDVRHGGCAAAVAPVQGTGLPVAGAARLLTTPLFGITTFGITDDTTLGYLSPGRPTS